MSAAPLAKPLLRGVFHQWASVLALGAGLVLVATAPSARVALATGLFACSLVTLFAISATYHRVNWSAVGRARMRKLDHASIFILIAGTYTPIAMLGLPTDVGNSLLRAIWIAAALGIVQSLFWITAPKPVTAALALAAGWTLLPSLGIARQVLPSVVFGLIALGGLFYTLGALAYASQRPNPRPGIFGYHEVFHAMTIVGATLHFIAVIQLARIH